MQTPKPTIGVTGPAKGGRAAWLFTKLGVWLQGGKAVRITTDRSVDIDTLDALILGGGADIDPINYGENRGESLKTDLSEDDNLRSYLIQLLSLILYPVVYLLRKLFSVRSQSVDKERDEMEMHILANALKRDLPILGICRGAQLINVKLGGTLYQDITGFYGEVPRIRSIFPKKNIKVEPQSTLGEILNKTNVTVNALHRQAVHKLAPSLEVVAREDNDIIQAIELPAHSLLLGVQWHPEYMPQIECQRRIFRALVDAAKGDLLAREYK